MCRLYAHNRISKGRSAEADQPTLGGVYREDGEVCDGQDGQRRLICSPTPSQDLIDEEGENDRTELVPCAVIALSTILIGV